MWHCVQEWFPDIIPSNYCEIIHERLKLACSSDSEYEDSSSANAATEINKNRVGKGDAIGDLLWEEIGHTDKDVIAELKKEVDEREKIECLMMETIKNGGGYEDLLPIHYRQENDLFSTKTALAKQF